MSESNLCKAPLGRSTKIVGDKSKISAIIRIEKKLSEGLKAKKVQNGIYVPGFGLAQSPTKFLKPESKESEEGVSSYSRDSSMRTSFDSEVEEMKNLEDKERKEVLRRLERIETLKMQNMIRGAFKIEPYQHKYAIDKTIKEEREVREEDSFIQPSLDTQMLSVDEMTLQKNKSLKFIDKV